MGNVRKRWRQIVPLIAVAGMAASVGAHATSARANGVSREHLVAQGWTCVEFALAHRYSCFDPGEGRPFPGNPYPRPTYNFLGFDLSSDEFLYTGHLIRQDFYHGQPCAPGREPYEFRALIGYYECVHQ